MAYFAKLGTGNIVEQVISINNSVITDANGFEQEQLGVDFINKLYNTRDVWKQTSYNNNIRKNYAGIGFQYDQQRDAFIPPKPFNSWILNEDTCLWEAPIAYPQDNKRYKWNEQTISWDLVESNI
ncbi:hypothetical protein EB001_23135 [bacterium]|nr:hypothetical protein [bacterium]